MAHKIPFEERLVDMFYELESMLENKSIQFIRTDATLVVKLKPSTKVQELRNTIESIICDHLQSKRKRVCKFNQYHERLYVRIKREVHC